MSINLVSKIKANILGIAFFIITFFFFSLIIKLGISTDIQSHIEILNKYLRLGYFPNPPLYYFCIYLVDFIVVVNFHFVVSSILVLSIFSALKFNLVKKYFLKDVINSNISVIESVTFSLMFCSPIYIYFLDGNVAYMGKFTSTIWHNSTIIFVFPICIWLFLQSLNFLNDPSKTLAIKLIGISILILLSKPSFLFAFIIVFPIISLYKFGRKNMWFIISVIVCTILFILLIVQKNVIYQNGNLDRLVYGGAISQVIIAPFKVWLSWAQHPFMNILTSFLFVLSFIILKFHTYKKDLEILYALGLLLVSLSIFFIFAESGPRFNHGNFYWQIPITFLIVNMVLIKNIFLPFLKEHINWLTLRKVSTPNKWILFFYSLHFISGIYYMVRILLEKSYV